MRDCSAAAAARTVEQLKIAFTMPTTDTGLWLSSATNCLILTGGWSRASTRRFSGFRALKPARPARSAAAAARR